MQVIFHTGAHGTDNDRLLKCLLRNTEKLAGRGVAVPGPGKYRTLLAESFRALENAAPADDARDVLLDGILDGARADRLILSNGFFFGSLRFAIQDGQIYPNAARRISHLHRLFPGDEIEMFMGLRNPASLLPAVMEQTGANRTRGVLGGKAPQALSWSDCLLRIREAAPDVRLTIWCNEDSPVIWPQIIRDLAGLPAGEKIVGGFDLLAEIMSAEGMQRFRAYLQDHPRLNDSQKRRVMVAFLEKFAIAEKLEEELDMPGWTDAMVDDLTGLYDADTERIRRMPGIRFIAT